MILPDLSLKQQCVFHFISSPGQRCDRPLRWLGILFFSEQRPQSALSQQIKCFVWMCSDKQNKQEKNVMWWPAWAPVDLNTEYIDFRKKAEIGWFWDSFEPFISFSQADALKANQIGSTTLHRGLSFFWNTQIQSRLIFKHIQTHLLWAFWTCLYIL